MNYHPVLHIFFGFSAALHAIARREDPAFNVRLRLADWAILVVVAFVILTFIGVYSTVKVGGG